MEPRVAYLGTKMDLPSVAFAAEHLGRGHSAAHLPTLGDLPQVLAPDVVIHALLERAAAGPMISPCTVANRVPSQTLLVPIFDDFEPSHAMMALHVLRCSCHGRILLHRPGDHRSAGDVIHKIETAARGPDAVGVTSPIPTGLLPDVDPDLGEIMSSKDRFASLLYTAAADRTWGSWRDLSRLLHNGDGVAKNTNSELSLVLRESRVIPPDEQWTAQRFVRFVTEYQSFILAFGQGHLGFDPPTSRAAGHHVLTNCS